MGVSNWMVEGIGLKANRLYPFLNREKCIAKLIEQLEEELHEEILEDKDNFNINDYMRGNPFQNIADLLCHCDDSNRLTYGDDGDGEYYLLYPPTYPWLMQENEPQSIEEVHELLKKAVKCLCDITDEQIEELIDDDLYEYGCE